MQTTVTAKRQHDNEAVDDALLSVNPTSKKHKSIEVEDGVAFELSSKRRVTVRKWKSSVLIDIREYYESNGDLKPGKKGISLTLEQWKSLKEMTDSIDEAIEDL